jgi:LDH2 family malate/lactate/ureidoglycolate dehydrogenase
MALDIGAIADPDAFGATAAGVLRDIRTSALRPGFDAIRIPGDRSLGQREARRRDGIPIPPALRQSLDQVAKAHGLPPLAEGA